MSTTKLVITILVAVMVALVGLQWVRYQYYDYFAGHHLGMKLDRTSYGPGDTIRLAAIVTPGRGARLRVYHERQKSFCIFLRRASGAGVDFADNDFLKCTKRDGSDSFESVTISPEKPFVLEIEGRLTALPDGKLLFDFGPFGSFIKERGPQFLVGGFWRPIKHAPEDSLEDYTDTVLITIEPAAISSKRNPSNEALEWTWPSSSTSELNERRRGFVEFGGSLEAGHATQRQCYPEMSG